VSIIYALLADSVFLNRGNHEDFAICCTYGFQQECCSKYSDITFGMFVEVFHHIPLFAVINHAVFVVHGGLFHCGDATLADLDKINREDFSLKDLPENGDQVEGVTRDNSIQFLKRLQRDALWSDPMDKEGLAVNPRGAGVAFGPDITRKFLELNHLRLVVRSHECVRTGFDKPFQDDDANKLFTVFSASNYGGGGNSAAYLVFSPSAVTLSNPFTTGLSTTNSSPRTGTEFARTAAETEMTTRDTLITSFDLSNYDPASPADDTVSSEAVNLHINRGTEPALVDGMTDLFYSVFYFDLSVEDEGSEENTVVDAAEFLYASYSDGLSLYDIILAHKPQLLNEFAAFDVMLTGTISKSQWAAAMSQVIKLTLSWQKMFSVMMLEDCIVNNYALLEDHIDDDHIMIDYRMFLNSYTAALVFNNDSTEGKLTEPSGDDDCGLCTAGYLSESEGAADHKNVDNTSGSCNGGDIVKITDSVDDEDEQTLVTGSIVDTLYAQHRKLIAIFRFFDRENTGTISADNFYKGCELLNKMLPANNQIKDVDKLIGILDVAQRSEIDVNVFFEMFRLSNINSSGRGATQPGIGMDLVPPIEIPLSQPVTPLSSRQTPPSSTPNTPTSANITPDTNPTLNHLSIRVRRGSADEGDLNKENGVGGILRKPSFRRSSSSRLRSESVESLHGNNVITVTPAGAAASANTAFVSPRSPYKPGRTPRSGSFSHSVDGTTANETVDINGVSVSVERPARLSVEDSTSFKLGSLSIDV
jgi:diadenosine tetraphosphatase ApaH/serine/threonine PP2A family protein phosphatase